MYIVFSVFCKLYFLARRESRAQQWNTFLDKLADKYKDMEGEAWGEEMEEVEEEEEVEEVEEVEDMILNGYLVFSVFCILYFLYSVY